MVDAHAALGAVPGLEALEAAELLLGAATAFQAVPVAPTALPAGERVTDAALLALTVSATSVHALAPFADLPRDAVQVRHAIDAMACPGVTGQRGIAVARSFAAAPRHASVIEADPLRGLALPFSLSLSLPRHLTGGGAVIVRDAVEASAGLDVAEAGRAVFVAKTRHAAIGRGVADEVGLTRSVARRMRLALSFALAPGLAPGLALALAPGLTLPFSRSSFTFADARPLSWVLLPPS